MNHVILKAISIVVVGVFAIVIINSAPVVHAQSTFPVPPPPTTPIVPVPPRIQPSVLPAVAQPCANNGTNVLGPNNDGKQIQNQENQCTGTPRNVNQAPTIISLPIANAGISQTVASGASVTLNGGGSTGSVFILNGVQTQANIISYAWTQVSGPTVALNGANTVTPTFVAPSITNTTSILSFSLSVTDSIGQVSAPSRTFVSVTSLS